MERFNRELALYPARSQFKRKLAKFGIKLQKDGMIGAGTERCLVEDGYY